MIYQLPNGKIIHLSVEEYLDLTDQDIQYLISVNAGDYAGSPFYGSIIRQKGRPQKEEELPEEEDTSIDYHPDLEEPLYGSVSDEAILDDEWPDFPEDIASI